MGEILGALQPPPRVGWREIEDVARSCPHPVGVESTGLAQRWILDERKKLDTLKGLVVSDGCMLNDCAYYVHWAGRRPDDFEIALDLAQTYDVLLSLPADPRLRQGDGLRPENVEFSVRIQDLQTELFGELQKPIWRLPPFDRYDRRLFVEGQLKAIYQDKVLRQRMVALAFVVNGGRLLMVRRPIKGTPEADGLWDVVAGAVDFGEVPSAACVRECQEEMGLQVRPVEQIGPVASRLWMAAGDSQFQALIVAFRCELTGLDAPTPLLREVADWKWVDLASVGNLNLVPSLKPCLEILQGG